MIGSVLRQICCGGRGNEQAECETYYTAHTALSHTALFDFYHSTPNSPTTFLDEGYPLSPAPQAPSAPSGF